MKIYEDFDQQSIAIAVSAGAFKTVEAYNEQYQNTTNDDPKGYPALYIELLEPVNWKQAGNQFQEAVVRSRLHVVDFSLKTGKSKIHSISQTAFETFNQKALFTDPTTQITTEWMRVASTLPKRYRQLKVLTIDFEFKLFDRSGVFPWVEANVTFNIPTDQ